MQFLPQDQLVNSLGAIDIYLWDQVMKGNLQPGMKILDAGCGHGRNLYYFLKTGYEVFAIDQNPDYIHHVKNEVTRILPYYPLERFRIENILELSFPPETFDLVISLAVLHFSPNEDACNTMLQNMWEMVKPGGLLFVRCASEIGLEGATFMGEGRWLLPDHSERYLLTRNQINLFMQKENARQVEPLKTTNVQDQRWMTTWVVQKLHSETGI